MIIVVTGSRHATFDVHGPVIRTTLSWIAGVHRFNDSITLYEGEAAGADLVARRIAENEFHWHIKPFPAEWNRCNRAWIDPLNPDKPAPCQTSVKGRGHHRKLRANGLAYCPDAGFRRNQTMIDTAALHAEERKICVAFPMTDPWSRGTADCLTRAWRSKIATFIVPLSS